MNKNIIMETGETRLNVLWVRMKADIVSGDGVLVKADLEAMRMVFVEMEKELTKDEEGKYSCGPEGCKCERNE